MNNKNKTRFVCELVLSIQNDVLELIENDKLPENWDGVELRQYLADKFADSVYPLSNYRKKNYINDCIVKNL